MVIFLQVGTNVHDGRVPGLDQSSRPFFFSRKPKTCRYRLLPGIRALILTPDYSTVAAARLDDGAVPIHALGDEDETVMPLALVVLQHACGSTHHVLFKTSYRYCVLGALVWMHYWGAG